jgi:branched-chain amino acid aminotransferase
MCDELFLTGTAVGVAPIVRVDHRPIKDAAIGPVARKLQQSYFDATRGHLEVYRKWLLPIYEGQEGQPQAIENVRRAETSVA